MPNHLEASSSRLLFSDPPSVIFANAIWPTPKVRDLINPNLREIPLLFAIASEMLGLLSFHPISLPSWRIPPEWLPEGIQINQIFFYKSFLLCHPAHHLSSTSSQYPLFLIIFIINSCNDVGYFRYRLSCRSTSIRSYPRTSPDLLTVIVRQDKLTFNPESVSLSLT